MCTAISHTLIVEVSSSKTSLEGKLAFVKCKHANACIVVYCTNMHNTGYHAMPCLTIVCVFACFMSPCHLPIVGFGLFSSFVLFSQSRVICYAFLVCLLKLLSLCLFVLRITYAVSACSKQKVILNNFLPLAPKELNENSGHTDFKLQGSFV